MKEVISHPLNPQHRHAFDLVGQRKCRNVLSNSETTGTPIEMPMKVLLVQSVITKI